MNERGGDLTSRQISGSEAYMDKVECVVIGAGVIGLAVARRLAQAGREVIVLEAAEGIGTVTSSRNSEVIHAGIYYKRRQPDGADVRQRQARALSTIAAITASRTAIAAS